MVGDVTLEQFQTKTSIPNANKVLLSQMYGILSLQVCAPPPSSSEITEYIKELKTAQRGQLSDLHVKRAEFCVLCLYCQPMKNRQDLGKKEGYLLEQNT